MIKSDHQCLLEFRRDAVSILHKRVAFGSHKSLENVFFEHVCSDKDLNLPCYIRQLLARG